MVESLPGVGVKSPNLNLNNDVLQEVRVTLELSIVVNCCMFHFFLWSLIPYDADCQTPFLYCWPLCALT